jgi:NADH:ubiquinone oxidoreductase subunit 6 (subunit J)
MVYLTLGFLLLFALLAVLLRDILLSVLSLAAVSALLSIAFYQLNSPVAGAFELSVGAGLITVLAVLTISFVQKRKEKRQAGAVLWVALSLAAVALIFFLFQALWPQALANVFPETAWGDVGEVLWKVRLFDLLPQILVILAAVLGILALLRKEGENKEK